MGMSLSEHDVAARANYHFTTEERRNQLYAAFQKSGSTSDLGTYLHAKQDSYSHAGYGPRIGHLYAGVRPDMTHLNVPKADRMARDTFDILTAAKGKLGEKGAGIDYSQISDLVDRFNRAEWADQKTAALREILKRIGYRN